MIINNQESEVVEILGEVSSKKATINADEVRKLQYILTEGLYKDPVGAVINELCANAVDAVIEAGKDPIENPIRVELGYKDGSYFIEIHDFGIGMSKEFFENSFMSYLTSTKDKNNNTTGSYGIGGKSFAALKRSVNFIITKDGKQCNYLCYKGAEGVEYDLLSEIDTDKENGVLFKMKIDGWSEYEEFKRKAKQKLTYYDTAVLIIDGIPYKNKVYRNELFQFAEESPYNNVHITLKDVVYPIDYGKLNIPSLNLPLGIRFGLEDGLVPTPSREEILYSKETIELIKSKVMEIADWFINKHNSEKATLIYDNIWDYWGYIGYNNFNVNLGEKIFSINTCENNSNLRCIGPKLTSISLKPASFYKSNLEDIFYGYNKITLNTGHSWKTKHLSGIAYYLRHSDYPVILYNNDLRGDIKTFLGKKYPMGALFIRKTENIRNLKNYRNLLHLNADNKAQWRDYIKEWQSVENQILSKVLIDESNCENTQEFLDYKAEKKEERKQNRQSPTYEGLNKQSGEITLRTYRKSYNNISPTAVEVSTEKISNLNNLRGLYIWFTSDSIPDKTLIAALSQEYVKFVMINKTEVKHINNLKNWIVMDEFKKSKPFARLATVLKIEKIEQIQPYNWELVKDFRTKYDNLFRKVTDYRNDNDESCTDTVRDIILDEAEKSGNWDMSIYSDVLEYEKLIKTFAFLNYLNIDRRGLSIDDKKVIANIAYIMLKHNKVNCAMVEDYELVEKVPQEVIEQMYTQEMEVA